MRLTYLIGEPGSGKTTLMEVITAPLPGMEVPRPFARFLYECGVVQLGARRAVFAGTDTLSMSVQPKVVEWAAMPDYPDIVAEGDRLANTKFFSAMADLGYDLCIVHCRAPANVIAVRRENRAAQHGMKEQDATWVQGRATKVKRLADDWATHELNMDRPVEQILADAVTLPVLKDLWEART